MYMKKKYFKTNLILGFMLFTTSMFAQKQISGNVTSSDIQPLPGVSILVKGTTNGVMTDFDGKYTISNVNNNATLVYSYLGFTTKEVLVGNQTTINVSLEEDITTLDDVVVIGYGAKKKAEVIGSVAQVSGDVVKKSPAANLTTSLAGRLPGLVVNQRTSEPGRENVDILIRGKGTFGDNSVLIVIDGIPGRDGLSRLDPEDIESISVLKDASASIYGARASNGVILVTTKRGKIGKPKFTFTSNYAVTVPTRFVENANAFDYARQINATQTRSGGNAPYSDGDLTNFSSPSFNFTNWWKEVYDEVSSQTRHNLSLRGGTESTKYFLSLGATKQDGITKTDNSTDIRQYNYRSNIDVKATNRLDVGLDLAGRKENYEWYGANAFDILSNTAKRNPFDDVYRDGKLFSPENGISNPLAFLQKEGGYNRQENSIFNGTLKLNYKIPGIQGLSVDASGSIDFIQNYHKSLILPVTQYIPDGSNVLIENQIGSTPKLSESYFRQESLTFRSRIAYVKTFNDVHNLNTFLAYEENRTTNNGTNASREGGLISLTNDQLSSGAVDDRSTNGSSAGENTRQSYFGRVDYNYSQKYFAQFHFRYDGSFNFPKGNRFGFFPAVTLGWRVSEENFLKDNATISNLKLKTSWGQLGNDRVGAFQFLNRFGPDGSFAIGGGNVPVISTIGKDANPNITWETSEIINLGLEAGFFNNKLTLEIDVFKEKRDDILAPRNVSVPAFAGLSLPDENIGKTENKGFEVIISYRNTFGEVGFNVGGNVAYNENKLIFQDAVEPAEEYQALRRKTYW